MLRIMFATLATDTLLKKELAEILVVFILKIVSKLNERYLCWRCLFQIFLGAHLRGARERPYLVIIFMGDLL